MTYSIHPDKPNTQHRPAIDPNGACLKHGAGRRKGFTLIELLVVMGIMLVLMSILLPALKVAYSYTVRSRMHNDLMTISNALFAYRDAEECKAFPPVPLAGTTGYGTGAMILCQALMAPNGSKFTTPTGNVTYPGPGFKARIDGRTIGPFLDLDRFKMADPSTLAPGGTPPGTTLTNYVLLDSYKHPILYYPSHKSQLTDITTSTGGGFMGPSNTHACFDPNDNKGIYDYTTGSPVQCMAPQKFQVLMGDTNANGIIDKGETSAFTGDFVLWSAGPDETFGPATPSQPVSASNPCDDVANFERSPY